MALCIPSGNIERPSPTLRAASVRISRQVGAAPERIFDAWLGAMSPESGARVGGEFRIGRRRDGEGVEYSGEYLEIERPYRLVFSLFAEKYALRDDRVIVELAPVAGQSLLVLTHELSLPDPAERSRIRRGWARVLDRLVRAAADPLGSAAATQAREPQNFAVSSMNQYRPIAS